ncbi:BREX-1 system adenine-specific DNA-methyltransferase PglX [Jeotgalibaca caeni]|uniref:BREX-1 system adenine-specific DNA-methyltransferase PglX n=1 Tax=Jeotgalibaca caeni TaxID=3028623 RepID=UPI00237E6CBB|nr:BREX-1 system adenine-specific DNA-methyltransferase PglX [Jeotgalibaca caeni]MDE1549714.1 BREX-1 system adenine-specific DNA-methyltransferase PglX [Jeotgalibaca caeni]
MEQTAVNRKEKTGIDKTAIKNFAVYSRNKLMNDIKNKAALIGITESGIQKPLSTSTGNVQFFDIGMTNPYQIEGKAINQRNELIRELDRRKQGSTYKTAYETLIEEVAYTWFNRIIAIRFMEVNNYMPNRLRVLSSGVSGINEPELITHVFESGLEFTEKEQEWIIEQKSNGSNIAMDELFQFLFIKQCNELNKNLPELFEKTNDYTELLLTVSYNDLEGVVYKIIHEVLEADFDVTMHGQIEILGWLYQYYNSDRKDEVINAIGKKVIKKQDIPAATQLFTTDWVVKYMVDNSLGKYWMERNSQSDLINSLEFLVTKEIGKVDEKISPEDIRFLDDCMGSGHILVYAFEVLMKIYEDEGYTPRETAKLIIEKNIYGLEIDKRSYQLSYFAIMMKARQYNRRILEEEVSHNLYLFNDSTSIDPNHINFLGKQLPGAKREKAELQINYLLKEFENAKELGSILRIKEDIDTELLFEFITDVNYSSQISFETIGIEDTKRELMNIVKIASVLIDKYDVVVTNPPYLNKFDKNLKDYLNFNYKKYSRDLFSVFIYRNLQLCKDSGYSAYMVPNVWMFINAYEDLRKYIIENKKIDSLID